MRINTRIMRRQREEHGRKTKKNIHGRFQPSWGSWQFILFINLSSFLYVLYVFSWPSITKVMTEFYFISSSGE